MRIFSHTHAISILRGGIWLLLIVAVLCSGCELWGGHCQIDDDCTPRQRCQFGFCQEREAGTSDASPDDPPTSFQPKACSCSIPNCDAKSESDCGAIDGCRWQQVPREVGPFFCSVDREAMCRKQAKRGDWQGRFCKCKPGHFLYAGLLCLPSDCTGACQEPEKQFFLRDDQAIVDRAKVLQKGLVNYIESTGSQEWTFLKGKTLGTPLIIEHRRLESNYPLRWRVIDHYTMLPMYSAEQKVGTWLLLHGVDATLKEIIHSPEIPAYPPISRERAEKTLRSRITGKITASRIQTVAVSKPDEIDGLQTLRLFPLWRFHIGRDEYFVTTFTELKGEPLVYSSMTFQYVSPLPKK